MDRPLTDVLVLGTAYSHCGLVSEVETAVGVGRAQKRVRVRGERLLRVLSDGTLGASKAAPFERQPLDWSRAYGGRDYHAESLLVKDPKLDESSKLGAYSCPRNTAGVGFAADVERGRLEGLPLPAQDDPDDPVEPDRLLAKGPLDWIDRPIAASYGPIDVFTFPRCMFHAMRPDWQTPARPIRELELGALLESDLADRGLFDPPDPRIFNCAPAGLAVCRLEGNERVTLKNLHRDHGLVEFDLPGERPRLLIEPPNTKTYELEATLQTVLLEPDEDRVTLTWTGSMPVAAVFPEEMCGEMRHGVLWDG
jgi:hypothetical protein